MKTIILFILIKLCSIKAACHCQDSWNNTYSCVRHVANDLDKVYCEFFDKEVS